MVVITTKPCAIEGHWQVPNSTVFGADKCPTLVFSPSASLDEYLSFQCLEQGDVDFICVMRHHWGVRSAEVVTVDHANCHDIDAFAELWDLEFRARWF